MLAFHLLNDALRAPAAPFWFASIAWLLFSRGASHAVAWSDALRHIRDTWRYGGDLADGSGLHTSPHHEAADMESADRH